MRKRSYSIEDSATPTKETLPDLGSESAAEVDGADNVPEAGLWRV